MGSLLLESEGQAHSDPAALNELQRVSVEYGEFACALVNFNLDAATALYTGKLGDDKNAPTSLSNEQYHVLVVGLSTGFFLLYHCVHGIFHSQSHLHLSSQCEKAV